ncbi:FAS1-like dehydratase domain-containing protein [Nocardia salmonicida]|uniref:FAS1-like dehydratase domain-containing protein n=1 Tax=Nocardia salmonicida TaxID=53431 RepID=UPI0033DAB370
MFARAIGDLNAAVPAVGSDVVPVTFPAAVVQFEPNYELRPTADRPWFGSGAEAGSPRPGASEPGTTRLHAEQQYEYVRPLRVGEELTATREPGKTWTKPSSQGGSLDFIETITRFIDDQGSTVVVARSVSVVVRPKVAQ